MAIVMQRGMEGSASNGRGDTQRVQGDQQQRVLDINLDIPRGLLGGTPALLNGNTIVDNNSLLRHPVTRWPAINSSTGEPLHMLLSQPTQTILSLKQSAFNQMSLSASLGTKPLADFQSQHTAEPKDAQAPTSKKTEESQKGEPTIVPCRARGMPKDHNPKTAFFRIPKSIAHGEGLHCSHTACREKGIRFRYCSVCAVPVAKRNFSTRHHHGELLEQSIREENGLVMRSEADEHLAKRRESVLREKRGRATCCSSSACTASSTSSLSCWDSEMDECSDPRRSGAKRRKRLPKKKRQVEEPTEDDFEARSRQYHDMWMQLLHQRPRRKGEALDDWLEKVTTISEQMSFNPALRAEVEYLHEQEVVNC